MKINIQKIIRPWFFTWAFFISTVIMMILCILFYIDGKRQVRDVVDRMTYQKDRQAADKILSEGDRYLKVTKTFKISGRLPSRTGGPHVPTPQET